MPAKRLPKLGDDIHLSKFGYKVAKSKSKRRKSLTKATKQYKVLPVMRRLNLIANYSQANQENYDRMRDDVEYLKRKYKQTKARSKTVKSRKSTKRTKSRKR